MYFYEFRAHGIQSFIFATNRLKEMVGASTLVDQLTTRDIHRAIEVLGLKIARADFARCAGGAFLVGIRDKEQALALRDFWSLYVRRKLPGLGFSHGVHQADRYDGETRRALAAALHAGRNRATPALPTGSPFAERAPLTGLPAVDLRHGRLIDHPSRVKQIAATGEGFIENKLELARDNDTPVFPLSFITSDEAEDVDTLLGKGEEDNYIAVIHADGNGLGAVVDRLNQVLAQNPALFPKLPADFSRGIEDATCRAARKACFQLFDNGLRQSNAKPHKRLAPIRFLVLGGDDVTLVTKACDALKFVTCFQHEFRLLTAEAFAKLKLDDLPHHLTASAGIAYIKAKQPFHMGYRLAETLCKAAKKASRLHADDGIPPDTLAFHRVTTAMIDDWDEVVARERTTIDGRVLTMQPYAVDVGPDSPLPALGDLYDLADLLKGLGYGPVRELKKALYLGESHTHKAQRRWRENLAKSAPDKLAKLESLLVGFTGNCTQDRLPLFDDQGRSPIADALALKEIGDVVGGKR